MASSCEGRVGHDAKIGRAWLETWEGLRRDLVEAERDDEGNLERVIRRIVNEIHSEVNTGEQSTELRAALRKRSGIVGGPTGR